MDRYSDDVPELAKQYARFERGRELYLIRGVAPVFGMLLGVIFIGGAVYPVFVAHHGQFFYLGLEILGVCVALFCIGAHAAHTGKVTLAMRCVAIAACLAVITPYAFLTGDSHFTSFAAAGLATFSLTIVLVGIISDGSLIWPVTLVMMVATLGIIWVPQSDITAGQRVSITIEAIIQQLGCALLMLIMNVAYRATIKSLGDFHIHNRHQSLRLFMQGDNLNILTHELKKPITNLAQMVQHTPIARMSPAEETSLRATVDLLAHMINIFPWDEAAVRREFMLSKMHLGEILEHARTIVNGGEIVAGRERIQLPHDGSTDVYVWGHSVNLRLLFVNLFANALQATRASAHPTITVRIGHPLATTEAAAQQPDEYIPERLEIQVSDNGTGIAEHDLPLLFDIYYSAAETGPTPQPHNDHTREPHGIGLWACQQYVNAMRGSIRACSAGVGQGATFTVTLDVCEFSQIKG